MEKYVTNWLLEPFYEELELLEQERNEKVSKVIVDCLDFIYSLLARNEITYEQYVIMAKTFWNELDLIDKKRKKYREIIGIY